MNLRVEHLEPDADLSEVFEIRRTVFNGEDGIPTADDFDGRDAEAEQFAAFDEAMVIGTARYRALGDDHTAKVERVAVLIEFRGYKVGAAIMDHLEQTAMEQGIGRLVLDSKLASVGFYLKRGYIKEGDEFEEVGLPHVKMFKDLDVDAETQAQADRAIDRVIDQVVEQLHGTVEPDDSVSPYL